jgi:two-component system response regulator AlgR
MNPRLFIVDDEAPARDRLKTLLCDIADECPHEVIGEAATAQAALGCIAQAQPDIVLLDVQMPGMTGIELAANLTRLQPAPTIIFVTAYDAYALKAFEVHALDYLLKPVRAVRLLEAIRRATEMRAQTLGQRGNVNGAARAQHPARQNFSVQERGRVLLVPVADVIYLKAELKYVTLRTQMHTYLIEESLTSIEEELNSVFVRVHRNTLVARNAVIGVERSVAVVEHEGEGDRPQESWQVILRNIEERLPISRRQWPVIKALVR